MRPAAVVRRCAVPGTSPGPVAAAARHDGFQVAALPHAARPGAVARRYAAAPPVGPSLDVAAKELHGTSGRRVAPWPEEAPPGGPSPLAVQPVGPSPVVGQRVGLLAQPPRQPDQRLFDPGRTSRCSPLSRRYQGKMLRCERGSKA